MSDSSAPIVPKPATPREVMRLAADLSDSGAHVIVATVLDRGGSAPSTPGQKLVLASNRTCSGTVGGGAIERRVLEEMSSTLLALTRGALETHERTPAPRRLSFRLGPELGMCCGGTVDVLLEPISPAVCVVIVGAGHIAVALTPLLVSLGYGVTVCDERDGFAEPSRFSGATLIAGHHRSVTVANPQRAAALVMTHDHALDQQAIEWALRAGFSFVGGVGSRAKAARTRQRLLAKDFDPVDVERVEMPLGVSIGARTPGEIAVSIAAAVVAWVRGAQDRIDERTAARVRSRQVGNAEPREESGT